MSSDFQYQPFSPLPYAANIADEIARSGDAHARAAMAIGQAQARASMIAGAGWGHAFENIGQIPAQVQQQQAALTDRKLKEQELSMTIEQRQAVQAQRVAMLGGRLAGVSSSPEVFADRVKQAVSSGLLLPEVGTHMVAQVQAAGPDGWPALQKQYVDFADSFATPMKLGKDETAGILSAGGTFKPVATGVQGPPTEPELAVRAAKGDPDAIAAMERLKPKPQPTEAGLAVTAAGGDATAQAALDKLKAQKNPPSLQDQYLAAKAKGDTTTADAILKTWRDEANAKRDPAAQAQLEAIRRLSQQEAQARLDDRDPTSEKNQAKYEQEYRTVLARGMSSRAGGLGGEDAKVQQANHLLAMLDQYFDPKSGEWSIPRVQLNELALGLAKLTAGNSPAGEGMMREFQQRTAKGDLAGALTYLTGQAVSANTQDITRNLRESIERQGTVAEQNREGEMRYLRGLAPTDLAEDRRQKLEATSLNPLRQSRVIQNKSTGERKLQLSLDGGKTWQ